MDTKNESVGKVIRHLYRKIQAENEKSFTRRQFDYGKEESQTPEDLSDVASEKLMQTFTDEVDPTGSECERPDYVTGNEDEHEVHCDWHNDTVLCWPRTLRGTTAYLPCFDEYNGIKYDSSGEYEIPETPFLLSTRNTHTHTRPIRPPTARRLRIYELVSISSSIDFDNMAEILKSVLMTFVEVDYLLLTS